MATRQNAIAIAEAPESFRDSVNALDPSALETAIQQNLGASNMGDGSTTLRELNFFTARITGLAESARRTAHG